MDKDLRDKFKINLREAMITTPIRLDMQTSENWNIYMDVGPDSNTDMQLTKLNLLLSGDITPETRKNLEYVDLRFKDRAYYK